MKIKSAIYSVARGPVGGGVFKQTRYGMQYTGRKANAVKRTPANARSKSIFSAVQSAWRSLSEDERRSWNNYREQFAYTDRVGKTEYLTGIQAFSRINSFRIRRGFFLTRIAPPQVTFPQIPNLVIQESSISLGIVFRLPGFTTIPAPNFVWFTYGTAPMSPGVSSGIENKYRLLSDQPLSSAQGAPVLIPYFNKFGSLDLYTGAKVFLKFVPIHIPTGIPGVPVSGFHIIESI